MMSPKEKEGLLSLVIIMALSLGLAGVVQAQSKTYIWDRLDVDITVLENSDIHIVETQQFTYTSGEFRYGYREIPTDRLEGITDVEVWEGDRQYQPGHGGDYTYETFYNDDGDFTIKWYYPGYRDSTHTYTIKYTVKGGLRLYDGGDQVFWKAVFPDRDVPVLASVVTVHLPAAFDPGELVIAAYDGSRGERQDVQIQNKGSEVVFTAGQTQLNHELEVRVQFPHGVVQGAPPGWQAAYDKKADHGRVIFGASFTLESGEEMGGDLVILGGSVVLETRSRVDGNVLVMGGSARISGEVDGDVVTFGGDVVLRPTAVVDGDLVIIGGNAQPQEGAIVRGSEIEGLEFEGLSRFWTFPI